MRRYEAISLRVEGDNGLTLPVCPDCGALVVNIPDHDAWHERIETAT